MRVQDEEFKTMIYDLMNGHYDLDKFDCAESSVVENEFAEGRYCEKLYSEMLARGCMSSPVRTGTWKS